MRLLMVHEDTREPGKGGGAESILRDHARAMKGRGHEVSWWWGQGTIQEAVAAFHPDLIHLQTVHNHIPGWMDMARWIQGEGIPNVWVLMDYWPFCAGRTLLRQTIDGETCTALCGVCDAQCKDGPSPAEWAHVVNGSNVVNMNQYSQAICQRNGIKSDIVVEMGIDTDHFSLGQKTPGSIYTSAAWAAFPVKGMQTVRAAIRGSDLNVNLITGLPREQVAAALKKADIYIFPSIYEETFGLCLCEAMASGCACIASDVAGARAQIEDGVTGILVPPRDPVALRAAIDRLLADPELRARLGQAARAHVEREHSLDAMAARWERVYDQVLATSKVAVGV